MSEFNFKDYVANNPLLKENKVIDLPKGLKTNPTLKKLIEPLKDTYKMMNGSEENVLKDHIDSWEIHEKSMQYGDADYKKDRKKMQEKVEEEIKETLEKFYKRINFNVEKGMMQDEYDKAQKEKNDPTRYKFYSDELDDLNETLQIMGTADEETMEYLQSLGEDKLVALEREFVSMFSTLRDLRYDGSKQLSKGASEISQRIHNFVTILRQVIKGYPVVKEENRK